MWKSLMTTAVGLYPVNVDDPAWGVWAGCPLIVTLSANARWVPAANAVKAREKSMELHAVLGKAPFPLLALVVTVFSPYLLFSNWAARFLYHFANFT